MWAENKLFSAFTCTESRLKSFWLEAFRFSFHFVRNVSHHWNLPANWSSQLTHNLYFTYSTFGIRVWIPWDCDHWILEPAAILLLLSYQSAIIVTINTRCCRNGKWNGEREKKMVEGAMADGSRKKMETQYFCRFLVYALRRPEIVV